MIKEINEAKREFAFKVVEAVPPLRRLKKKCDESDAVCWAVTAVGVAMVLGVCLV